MQVPHTWVICPMATTNILSSYTTTRNQNQLIMPLAIFTEWEMRKRWTDTLLTGHDQQTIIFNQTAFFSQPDYQLKQHVINTEKDFLQIHQVSQFNIRCTLLRGLKAESSDTSSSPPHRGNLDLPLQNITTQRTQNTFLHNFYSQRATSWCLLSLLWSGRRRNSFFCGFFIGVSCRDCEANHEINIVNTQHSTLGSY